MSIEVIDMKKEAKQRSKKPDRVRSTVWMSRDIWTAARHAAVDRNISFAKLIENALTMYLGVRE